MADYYYNGVPLAGDFGASGGSLPPGVTKGIATVGPRDWLANPLKPGEMYSGPTDKGPTAGVQTSAVTPSRVSALSASSLFSGSTESTALAQGFPMLAQMVDFTLRAQAQNADIALRQNADRRAAIDQSVNIARLMADLERVSPTRAAAMAASLGVKPDDSISFTNLFGGGTNFPMAGGNRVSGTIGGVPISLPSVFSGQEMAFLNANPNVARVTMDVADALGVPDIFSRSAAARIPAMGSIFAGGI